MWHVCSKKFQFSLWLSFGSCLCEFAWCGFSNMHFHILFEKPFVPFILTMALPVAPKRDDDSASVAVLMNKGVNKAAPSKADNETCHFGDKGTVCSYAPRATSPWQPLRFSLNFYRRKHCKQILKPISPGESKVRFPRQVPMLPHFIS